MNQETVNLQIPFESLVDAIASDPFGLIAETTSVRSDSASI